MRIIELGLLIIRVTLTLRVTFTLRATLTLQVTLTLLMTLTLLATHSHSFADDLLPERPTLKSHLQRQKRGPTTLKERYNMSRVGRCIDAPLPADTSSLVTSLALRYQLDCADIGSKSPSFVKEGKPHSDKRHLTNLKRLENSSVSTIREVRSSWWLAQQQLNHMKAHRLAEKLKRIPAPKRSSERYRLSSALELLFAAETGPILSEIETSSALQELKSMSREALGNR